MSEVLNVVTGSRKWIKIEYSDDPVEAIDIRDCFARQDGEIINTKKGITIRKEFILEAAKAILKLANKYADKVDDLHKLSKEEILERLGVIEKEIFGSGDESDKILFRKQSVNFKILKLADLEKNTVDDLRMYHCQLKDYIEEIYNSARK